MRPERGVGGWRQEWRTGGFLRTVEPGWDGGGIRAASEARFPAMGRAGRSPRARVGDWWMPPAGSERGEALLVRRDGAK